MLGMACFDLKKFFLRWRMYLLEQITILCSRLSFLRKQASSPRAPRCWMPDHVRPDSLKYLLTKPPA